MKPQNLNKAPPLISSTMIRPVKPSMATLPSQTSCVLLKNLSCGGKPVLLAASVSSWSDVPLLYFGTIEATDIMRDTKMILKGTLGTCSRTDLPVVSSPKATATKASIANLPLTRCSKQNKSTTTEQVHANRIGEQNVDVNTTRMFESGVLTSGAGPVKAITSWMLSVSFVSVILPILPVCAAVGALMLFSDAAHLTVEQFRLAEQRMCAWNLTWLQKASR